MLNTKEDDSVSQSRHVGQHDGDDISETQVADPVQCMASSVGGNILAHSLGDKTDDHENDHGDKTFAATPDVDDFGNGQVAYASENGGDNVGCGKEAVLAEGRSDEVLEVACHSTLELVNEGDEVEAV